MRTLLTSVLAAGVLAGLGAAAQPKPELVLGVEWRAGGGQLAWRSPTTLRAQSRAIDVGGASVRLAATSPDGSLGALARTDGQLRIMRLRPLRSVGALETGGTYIPAAFWPTAGRLVAVVGGDEPAVLVVDVAARRVIARRALEGVLYGAAATPRRLVTLLAPQTSIGQARLAVVAADGTFRTVPLPGVSAGFEPDPDVAGTGRMASPGLTLSPNGGRAAVVGLDTFLVVDLETLEISRAATRTLARATKRVEGWSRSAVWATSGAVAVVARTNAYDGDRPVSTTTGVRLHPLGPSPARLLDESATDMTRVGDTLLAFGGSALRGYTLDGTLRFELLAGRDTGYVQTAGGYAYVGSHNSTRFTIVDVTAGRVVGNAGTVKPTVLLTP